MKFTVEKAAVGTLAVTMEGYAYGTDAVPAPAIDDYPGGGALTYYYNTTEANEGGTEWKDIAGDALAAGDYYMYAAIAETDNYLGYTTEAVKFTVEKAAVGTLAVTMEGYTYGTDAVPEPAIDDYPGGGALTYYYNTTEANEGGTEWKDIAGETLAAGDYYMYAAIAETEKYLA